MRVPDVLIPFMGGITFLPFVRDSKLPDKAPVPVAATTKEAKAPPPAPAPKTVEAPSVAASTAASPAVPTQGILPLDALIVAKGEEIRGLKAAKVIGS